MSRLSFSLSLLIMTKSWVYTVLNGLSVRGRVMGLTKCSLFSSADFITTNVCHSGETWENNWIPSANRFSYKTIKRAICHRFQTQVFKHLRCHLVWICFCFEFFELPHPIEFFISKEQCSNNRENCQSFNVTTTTGIYFFFLNLTLWTEKKILLY